MSKEQACAALDIPPNDFVAVFIGQVRPYKGVGRLIASFLETQLANSKLLVAGTASDGMKRELAAAAGTNSNVRLSLEFVNQDDVQKYLRAADLVILPFTEILNSGSAILALSFDRPILAPAYGALAELREIVGPDWVRLYEGEINAEVIKAAVQWAKARKIHPAARAPIDALNWDRIAKQTIQVFSQCTTT
jgi:glycosyltransferase involved in cell wall biosynthesis